VIENRVSVEWGAVSMNRAHINLLEAASKKGRYAHYTLISGQDLPIKPTKDLYDELVTNKDFTYMLIHDDEAWIKKQEINIKLKYPKFMMKRNIVSKVIKKTYQILFGWRKKETHRKNYFGSVWMSLSPEFVEYLFNYYNIEELLKEYKHGLCVDETMMHTVFMNSPLRDKRKDYLTYVDWSEQKPSPKILTIDDYEQIINSDKFFARKFDSTVDNEIIYKLLQVNMH